MYSGGAYLMKGEYPPCRPPIPWEDFVADLPPPPKPAQERKQRQEPKISAPDDLVSQFLRDHPYLSEHDVRAAMGQPMPHEGGGRRRVSRNDAQDVVGPGVAQHTVAESAIASDSEDSMEPHVVVDDSGNFDDGDEGFYQTPGFKF